LQKVGALRGYPRNVLRRRKSKLKREQTARPHRGHKGIKRTYTLTTQKKQGEQGPHRDETPNRGRIIIKGASGDPVTENKRAREQETDDKSRVQREEEDRKKNIPELVQGKK